MESQWEMGIPAAYMYGRPIGGETLRVDDMLDFAQHDIHSSSSCSSLVNADASLLTSAAQFSVGDIDCNPDCYYPHHGSIADDIYIPTEEIAELEWLSNFVENSFSDIPIQSLPTNTTTPNSIHRTPTSSLLRGTRTKRSRSTISIAESNGPNHLPPSSWSSLTPSSSTTSSSSSSDFPLHRKKQGTSETAVRRCTHCASDKTPQWRTGPLGPKTLCNACGVRFKSGRLVPEYRPAASPTFVLTQHSNSHRKVLELRRQKELLILRRHDDAVITTVSGTEMMYGEFNVC